MCYSDFSIPTEFPIFMHNKLVLQYFHLYAKQFGLMKHIRFQHEILSVRKHANFADTGQWDLSVRNKVTGMTEDLVYDAVLVCTGHHAEVHKPTFPGLDRFKGKVIHSHDFKSTAGYEDKRIVIVGIGNSGGDAAVELSRVASQVYLSTRRGTWILNRVADHGLPVDMLNINRFLNSIVGRFPSLVSSYAESQLNKKFDHELYSLKPNHRVFSQHPMVNDDLPNRIICWSVVVKPNVTEFTESGVKFDDGTFEDNIDVVFLATGYVFGFPFLDKNVVEVKNNEIELFKYAFPPNLEKPTLAVIGFIQPIGAIMPICELQCRLATRLFKGDVQLPPQSEMWRDIKDKKEKMSRVYVKSQRHTIQVDFIPFLDELAKLNGCMPNFKKMFFRDPVLTLKCIFGPCTPYQYRLEGPGAWKGARKAILTQWDRTLAPLKTRSMKLEVKRSQKGFVVFFMCVVAIFIIFLSMFIKD
ncbi:flavin-containing monooxygenase 5-like isoform X2 [Mercenaria mercenaria]|nr:flavin-containing monooxygenase 5-like isoform X2 [Mercenaria mercenaria]